MGLTIYFLLNSYAWTEFFNDKIIKEWSLRVCNEEVNDFPVNFRGGVFVIVVD